MNWRALALADLGWPFSPSEALALAGADCSAGLGPGWPGWALALAGLGCFMLARVSQGKIVLSLPDPDLTGRVLALALVRIGSDLVETST